MSAIVGLFHRDGQPIAEQTLRRMVAELAHRGPDGTGVWVAGAVGLGHQMLWATPESKLEHQPLTSRAGALALTADARIDNRDELIRALRLTDRPAAEITDADLIMAAYEEWGEHCPERLLGDFAFALWDERKQIVFCARDHFGVKPCYYFASERLFAFATELKALLCLPEIPGRLNEVMVAEHLSGQIGDKESTFYRDIMRLAPGHRLTISRDSLRTEPFWSLDPKRELRLGSDAEYAQAFRALFTEAVRVRLRSAYPVGSMLSGGLDSSSITCLARDLLALQGQQLHTFSAVFDDVAKSDERPFIDAVLAQNGVCPHLLRGDQSGPLNDLERHLWHHEEASIAGNLHYTWRMYDGPVREHGVRVILDGFDGDTTVSHGVGYLIELARELRLLKMIREARGYAKHFDNCPPWPIIWWHVERYSLSPRMRRAIRPLQRTVKSVKWRIQRLLNPAPGESERVAFIDKDFVQRIDLRGRHEAMSLRYKNGPLRSEREFHYRRMVQPAIQQTLETLNKAAGAFGLETRFPFWDVPLAEFCLSLPPEQKLHQGWNRMVMRRAMNDILPREVQWRGGKADMSHSFEHGLRAHNAELLQQVMQQGLGRVEDYVDVAAVRAAYNRFLARQASGADVMGIWKSVSLALWLQQTNTLP